METPPYEPIDDQPTARPAGAELRARGAAVTTSSGDRTKKAVAVAAVASFLTAMGAMAVARSGSGGSNATTPTTVVSPSAGFDDGSGAAPTFGGGGDTLQPGGAQPAAPAVGRGDDDFGRDDTSSHGS